MVGPVVLTYKFQSLTSLDKLRIIGLIGDIFLKFSIYESPDSHISRIVEAHILDFVFIEKKITV